MRQHGFAGARLALHQQRALQCYGGIYRHFQITRGDVSFSALERRAHTRLLVQSWRVSDQSDQAARRKEPPMPNTRPYGSWLSPITSELIVAESIGLSGVQIDGGDIYW